MFTGIVTDVGRVRAVRDTNRDRRFEIETRFDLVDRRYRRLDQPRRLLPDRGGEGRGLVRRRGLGRDPVADHPVATGMKAGR